MRLRTGEGVRTDHGTIDYTKASPLDITTFHRDTSIKYPTFDPQPTAELPILPEKLSDGIKPLPPRPNYHSTEITSPPRKSDALRDPMAASPAQAQGSAPLPGTPAPTPPQSPIQKPKKQQYQTDPTKPFLFPYSRGGAATTSLVPFAIQEADKLYSKHSFVSLGLWQLWQEREECLREERGLGMRGLIGFDRLRLDDDNDDDDDDDLDEADMEAMRRDWRYEEQEADCLERGDKDGAKKAREKKAAARRLHRVDIIYVSNRYLDLGTSAESKDAETHVTDHAELRYCPAQIATGDSHGSRRPWRSDASPHPFCLAHN